MRRPCNPIIRYILLKDTRILHSKPHAPGGTAMNETYEGLKIVYTEDEFVYNKKAAKVEDYLGQQLVQ